MATDKNDPLSKETKNRLKAARQRKSDVLPDLKEAYFFTNPGRELDLVASQKSIVTPGADLEQGELMTAKGMEASADFSAHLITTFMPENFDWLESAPGIFTPLEDFKSVEEDIKKRDKKVLDAIKAAGFQHTAQQSFDPDAAVGTVAMLIEDKGPAGEPVMQAIPITDFEINVGPFGLVDDRFICRSYRPEHLLSAVGKEVYDKLPDDIKQGNKRANKKTVPVVWGWWRDWSDFNVVLWKYVLMVDEKVYDSQDLRGIGSCPFIIGRINPPSDRPYGRGPTIKSLPWLRMLDCISEATFEASDMSISPPFVFDDDGVLRFDNGIEAGIGYPKSPGSDKPEPLLFGGNPDIGFFTLADLERAIERLHYIDRPEQAGKTPPSASQWVDQVVESQRRIGPVGQKFWAEFAVGVFHRFQYLLENRGVIETVTKDSKAVASVARNPAAASMDHQEVQTAIRFLEVAMGFFPEEAKMRIDANETMENIKTKMRDELVKILPENEVVEKMEQFGAALGAMQQQGAAPDA